MTIKTSNKLKSHPFFRNSIQLNCIYKIFQETIAAEKFYGTLVDTIDSLLGQMGANDLGCRERAVCALYGDPFKHTPYSNLVSGHLSK